MAGAMIMNDTASFRNASLAIDRNLTCDADFLAQYAGYRLIIQFGIIVVISVFVTIASSFMQKRKRLGKCCYGYPGLPSPMDFLVTPRYRWIYMALFFVMAATLISTISALSSPLSSTNVYLNIFYKIIVLPVTVITLMTIQFFPLFVCAELAPFPISTVAHFLGFIYAFVWVGGVIITEAYTYLEQFYCRPDGTITTSSFALGRAISKDTPMILTAFYIVFWYLYRFLQDIVKGCLVYSNVDINEVEWVKKVRQRLRIKKPVMKEEGLADVPFYHIQHVRCLLAKPPPPKVYGKVKAFFVKVFEHFFPYNKYDRLPLPYLGSVAAVVMLIYQLSIEILGLGAYLINTLSVRYTEQIRPALNINGSADAVLSTIVVGVPIVITISPFVSLLLVLVLLVHMTGAVSKDIKMVAKYGLSEKPPSTLSIVPGMWKYIGVQIGYAISAWAIYTLITFVIGVAIALIYICLVLFTDWVISIALTLIIPIVFPKLIYYTQYLICRFVFFEDRQGKFISITNRRLFNWFAFILFFYNGIAGVISALFRVLISSLFGLLLLFRLDTIVLMKGFEGFDFGHKKYLSFLFLYTAYNNAILHVFVNLLKNSVSKDQDKMDNPSGSSGGGKHGDDTETFSAAVTTNNKWRSDKDSDDIEMIPLPSLGTHARSRQVCNRWLLAYTLLRNPSLVSYRRTIIKTELSENSVITTPAVFLSVEEGESLNKDDHCQEGQSNSNHSLTELENNSRSPVCDTSQQPDSDITNTAGSTCIVGPVTSENHTELELEEKTLPPLEVDMDEGRLIVADTDKSTNCQSIERGECANPDAADERNSQSPSVLPVAESICVVEPVDKSQIVSISEPLEECETVHESYGTEVPSSNNDTEEINSIP